MPTVSLFVQDSRYFAPTLYRAQEPDDAQAGRMARQILRNSPWHLSVDVYQDDRLIAHLDQSGSAHPEITDR